VPGTGAVKVPFALKPPPTLYLINGKGIAELETLNFIEIAIDALKSIGSLDGIECGESVTR